MIMFLVWIVFLACGAFLGGAAIEQHGPLAVLAVIPVGFLSGLGIAALGDMLQ